MLIDRKTAIARIQSGKYVYAYGLSRGTLRVKAISSSSFTTSMNTTYPLSEINSFSTTA